MDMMAMANSPLPTSLSRVKKNLILKRRMNLVYWDLVKRRSKKNSWIQGWRMQKKRQYTLLVKWIHETWLTKNHQNLGESQQKVTGL
ncbi:hypothetical protein RSAG8_04319, partial [Rhizoctonia solani AG-8 WAC10335]